MCNCCVLLYCTHPILLKTANEDAVFVIPGPAKMTVITSAFSKAEVPNFLRWLYQSSADVPENKAPRTGCTSSNASFPSSTQNCFDLKFLRR